MRPDDAHGTGAPETCIVNQITPLSPAEAAAIPPRFRP
jgi:hypothetical protein